MDVVAPWFDVRPFLLAVLLGILVGASELVSRYRDAPSLALRTLPALLYVGLNGCASLIALLLVVQFKWLSDIGGAGASPFSRLILQALVAGFSAMALFRSSLFTIRVGNSDIGIGPAAFLQILLTAADRACDRTRAKPRALAVQEIMSGVSFEKAQEALPTFCFGLMQNVSGDEQRNFSVVIRQLRESKMEDVFKANSLGLELMNIVGDAVLRQAVNMLRSDIAAAPKPIIQSIQTIALLRNVDFTRQGKQIIDECIFLANKIRDTKLKAALASSCQDIAAMTLVDRQKVLFLSAVLIGVFGEEIVQTVLKSLPENSSVTSASASSSGPGSTPSSAPPTSSGSTPSSASPTGPGSTPPSTSRLPLPAAAPPQGSI